MVIKKAILLNCFSVNCHKTDKEIRRFRDVVCYYKGKVFESNFKEIIIINFTTVLRDCFKGFLSLSL